MSTTRNGLRFANMRQLTYNSFINMNLKQLSIEFLKILGLLTLQSVSLLPSHNYRLWSQHVCREEGGFPIIFIIISLIIPLLLIFRNKITAKALFAISISVCAVNAISVLFLDSFDKLADHIGWEVFLNFVLVNLLTTLLAYLLFCKNNQAANNAKKIDKTGWWIIALSIITSAFPISVRFTIVFFPVIWDWLIGYFDDPDMGHLFAVIVSFLIYCYPITILLFLFIFYRLTKKYLPPEVKIEYFEIGFIITAFAAYAMRLQDCILS